MLTFISGARPPAEALFTDADFARQRAFFSARQDLRPTPLLQLPSLADAAGLGALYIKDETARFGLNAFKSAGAIFAIATLRERGDVREGDTLVCASEGNHGRAVARASRTAGCAARVYMAQSVAAERVTAIESEGATVVRVAGSYDDAVHLMARDAERNGWTMISDTSWEGYEEIPRLIMLGYTRLLDEAETQWAPGPRPHVIVVQAGVGGLLGAAAAWVAWRYDRDRPAIIAVEPSTAACVQISVREGRPTTLPGPFETVMGGLRCGEVSPCAFETIRGIVDGYIAIEDEHALAAMRRLATPTGGDPVIEAGASGAAAVGGLMAVMADPAQSAFQKKLRLDKQSRVLAFVTEGVTDRAVFDRALLRD